VTSNRDQDFIILKKDDHWVISFFAMASPCEILVKCSNKSEAGKLASLAFHETRRIEKKYSRYRNNNIVYAINNSRGKAVQIDCETAGLLKYADHCFNLSDGLFDVTSGILRGAWTFKGQVINPDKSLIRKLLKHVGWNKVTWDDTRVALQPGMEIDLGGIGKEYAVDKVTNLLFSEFGFSLMVNFGGDIRTICDDANPSTWTIGIENPDQANSPVGEIQLINGAIATSGDAARYCLYKGKRLGHILNPLTGWPAEGAPRSVTVVSDQCLVAGLLATTAILQGSEAEDFLEAQEVTYHCIK
jgi:thiamine biosynthesis lipoprotein